MIRVRKRRRERKVWERRARHQIDQLLVEERPYLDIAVAGLPEQREELVALYRRLLEPIGYRLADLVTGDDAWVLHFEKHAHVGRRRE